MDQPVQPGEVLAEKYRVEKILGVGGMGVVVAATHLELDQRVALKFMHAGVFVTDEARSRFQREARIASKLKSEHVARVSDTGTLANGAPYIVMEFLEGTDLAEQLTQYGPMPVGFAAECIVQACDAIGEAHAHGIVHRDLKPANLFLTRHPDGSPLVKVLDFGISKASGGIDGGMAMTKTGALLGSPLYMSPEQMRSLKTVDARTDIWALGVILYELLTGRTPFVSETFGDLLLEVMTRPHAPLATVRGDVPPQVAHLVDGCLAKDPAARVQSVADVASVLAPFCSASGVVLAQRITALAQRSGTTGDPRVTAGVPVTVTVSEPNGAPKAKARGQARPPWLGIGAMGVIAVATVGFFALRAPRGTAAAASPDVAAASPPGPSAPPPPAPSAPPRSPASPPPPAVEATVQVADPKPDETPTHTVTSRGVTRAVSHATATPASAPPSSAPPQRLPPHPPAPAGAKAAPPAPGMLDTSE